MSALPLRIGLTGGIGSGKSTVAGFLQQLGAVLVDTDAIARALTAPGGAALPALATAFGPDILDAQGALDRQRMRALAFSQASHRQRLESVLHPLIRGECDRRAAAAGDAPLVFDVPLLVESGRWRDSVQRVLVVDCPEEVQVSRVIARSGWDEATVRQVIAQQSPRPARRAVADAVIHNEALTLDQLRDEVAQLWALWSPGP